MKIFISWSGTPSHNIALALKDWLPFLFTGIEPFVSSEGVRKGKRWQIEIAKELESSNFGIVCLTPDNTEEPWILFESGALSKSLNESSVSTLLTGGLRNGDIEGPLSHFQHTSFEKEDFFKLLTAINDSQQSGKQDTARLQKIFDKFWEELRVSVEKALKTTEKSEKKRGVEDMVRELLDVTNSIAKNMPQLPEILEEVTKRYGASLFPEDPRPVRRFNPISRPVTIDAKQFEDTIWAPTLRDVERHSPEMLKLLDGCAASWSNSIITVSFADEKKRLAFTKSHYETNLFTIASIYANFVGIPFRGIAIDCCGSPISQHSTPNRRLTSTVMMATET